MPIWILYVGCLSKNTLLNEQNTDSALAEDTSEVDVDTNGSPDQSHTYRIGADTIVVDIINIDGLRQYTMTTTHPLRDGYPQTRTFSEQADEPRFPPEDLG